jgi:histone deacetylase 1/2
LTLILAIKYSWPTRQLDFVLAYPQAPVECDLFMEIPRGHKLFNERKKHAIKLKRNLYGQKQAGRVWNQYLTKTLKENHFKQSDFDDCLFYFNDCIILIYVDDTIIAGPTLEKIELIVSTLSSLFKVEDQGDISDYLGVKVKQLKNGSFSLTQPHLIDSILKDLHFQPNTRPSDTPALSTKILQPDANGKHFDQSWEYRSLIGKLNFLEKSTRPDIAYAVHQCARFSATPKESHARAVRRIGRYLLATKNLGLTYQPSGHSFHCWADADFVGNWERSIAMEDINTARSRSGYLITYAACPLLWASKLQTEIALSTTEAEYISLSTALREVIPLMNLLSELRDNVDQNIITLPTLHCKLFEDNSGAYELATTPKMRPRTKHINVKYHHFRAYVDKKWISVKKVASEHQLADIFTKPLASAFFIRLRDIIMQTPNIAADQADEGV